MDYREFEAQIENGMIQVPQHLHAYEHTRVRVMIIEETTESQFDRLQHILSRRGNTPHPISSDPDPLDWQKDIRHIPAAIPC